MYLTEKVYLWAMVAAVFVTLFIGIVVCKGRSSPEELPKPASGLVIRIH